MLQYKAQQCIQNTETLRVAFRITPGTRTCLAASRNRSFSSGEETDPCRGSLCRVGLSDDSDEVDEVAIIRTL